MNAFPYILADSDDTNWPKVIFGLIFFIIWGISALASWINKQQQEAKRRRVREQLERSAARMPHPQQPLPPPRQPVRIAEGLAQRFPDVLLPPAPMPPPPLPHQQRRPMPPPRPPAPLRQSSGQAPKPLRRQPKQPQVRRPMPLPALPVEEEGPTTSMIQPTAPIAPVRAAKPAVDATAVANWLKPATLRQQFILTEILQPPLALREPSDHS